MDWLIINLLFSADFSAPFSIYLLTYLFIKTWCTFHFMLQKLQISCWASLSAQQRFIMLFTFVRNFLRFYFVFQNMYPSWALTFIPRKQRSFIQSPVVRNIFLCQNQSSSPRPSIDVLINLFKAKPPSGHRPRVPLS